MLPINNKYRHDKSLPYHVQTYMVQLYVYLQSAVKFLCQIGQDTAITEQQIKVVKAQLEKISRLKKVSFVFQMDCLVLVYIF